MKQLTVFIENREGRLEKVSEILKENNIDILTLSLADTSEYGLLRMIVSDADKAKCALKEKGFSAMITDVLAVEFTNQVGSLQKLLEVLKDINIEYMYALSSKSESAIMLIKVNKFEKAKEAIIASDMKLVEGVEDIA